MGMYEDNKAVNPCGGRPSKLTYELMAKICLALRVGNYFEVACRMHGVTKNTGLEWLRKGASTSSYKSIYRRFLIGVDQAIAESEARMIGVIERAEATGDWRAAAFRLERRFGERWQKRETVTQNVNLSLADLLKRQRDDAQGDTTPDHNDEAYDHIT